MEWKRNSTFLGFAKSKFYFGMHTVIVVELRVTAQALRVHVGGQYSGAIKIRSDVTHGSLVGLLLFLPAATALLWASTYKQLPSLSSCRY